MRYLSLCVVGLLLVGCGGSKSGSPTSPSSPSSTQTRVMHIDGQLDFGPVRVGESSERSLRVFNNGNAALTVDRITIPSGGGFAASWTAGTIAPNGAFQDVRIRFSPTEPRSYNGTLTFVGNHTSGTNTRDIDARGFRDPFRRTGSGAQVFDMPTGITRVHITGNYNGFCENFIVHIGGRGVVNEILGSCSVGSGRTYDGTHLVSGTVVEVKNSIGINWMIEEIQQ